MNNNEQIVNVNQNIILKDRKKLEITGIKKIESLNNEEFLIDTVLGLLYVKGDNLEMQQLDVDKGHIWISGVINIVEYLENTKKEKQGFFSKVFK